MFTESLLAASLTFAPWHGDIESPEAPKARLQVITEAIDTATGQVDCNPNPSPCSGHRAGRERR